MLRFLGQFCVVFLGIVFFVAGFAVFDETSEQPFPPWNPAVGILVILAVAIESNLHRLVQLRESEGLSEAERESQHKANRRWNNLFAGIVLGFALVFGAILIVGAVMVE